MKSSYSQNNTYTQCSRYWDLSYNEGWRSEAEGASTYFGSAIDTAVMDMLGGNQDWLKSFYSKWEYQAINGQGVKVFDNDKIIFANKDFDADILDPVKDIQELDNWARELKLIDNTIPPNDTKTLIGLYKKALKDKTNPYVKLTKEQLKYFNRCSWLSMKRKGKILLEAFKEQFFPKIKKVHALQKRSKIDDSYNGDSLIGYIDMIVEIEGYDKPIIFDLKTSGMLYDDHMINSSQQLTLYAAMEGHNYNTNLVGYVVLFKNIQKDIVNTCNKCGNKKSTSHRTCEVTTNNVRCGGEWIESKIPRPTVQVMVRERSEEQIKDYLADASNIMLAMRNKIVFKNVNKCLDWYGSRCPMYSICHKGDSTGLVKKK